jgi:hypothetical protein
MVSSPQALLVVRPVINEKEQFNFRMLRKINSYFKKIFEGRFEGYILDRMNSELEDYVASTERDKSTRILFGPSFSIHPPCFVHDRILSYALELRGAQIIPIYCDAVQLIECNVSGGVWKGKSFEKSCKKCINLSEKLWRNWRIPPIKLSQYLKDDEVESATKKVARLGPDEWPVYFEDDMPYGSWARDILVNNYVVGDYHLIQNYHELGLAHLKNLLLLKMAYEKIIDEVKPDRAVSNDSYYGMWAILQKLYERKGIPFYSTWIGGRQNSWCYAYNDAAMNLDFSRAWKKFSQIPLDERRKKKVQNWLEGRSAGKEMIFDTASLSEYKSDEFDLKKINEKKPTALLAANVIWDLAALNKQVVFSDMIDWIAQTINWFATHPEFQLIIKPHPAELHPSIPATEERVGRALSQRGINVPDNVFLLSPKVNLDIYQLFPIVNAGIVHTTTVGIEMAARGLPVITTARSPYRGFGFTVDPASEGEYFEVLRKTLRGEKLLDPDEQIDLSYKFIMFYQYHYYTKIDIMDYGWGETPRLKIRSIKDLLPGKNIFLDYVADSIIDGLPIVCEDRWPPES